MTNTEQQEKCMECRECCEYVEVPTSLIDVAVLEHWYMRGTRFYISNKDGLCHVRFYQPCVHLKENGCDIYENRPYVCKKYMCEFKCDEIKSAKDKACDHSMEMVMTVIREQKELAGKGRGA